MLNHVVLMGRLTADPELKRTPSDVSVASFTIAVDRDYTPKGQEKQTDFINIVVWRQTAEFACKYFSKGSMIAVSGGLQTRKYKDKNGNDRTVTEVVADHVYFAESKKQDQGYSKPVNTSVTPDLGDFEEVNVDDGPLPF